MAWARVRVLERRPRAPAALSRTQKQSNQISDRTQSISLRIRTPHAHTTRHMRGRTRARNTHATHAPRTHGDAIHTPTPTHTHTYSTHTHTHTHRVRYEPEYSRAAIRRDDKSQHVMLHLSALSVASSAWPRLRVHTIYNIDMDTKANQFIRQSTHPPTSSHPVESSLLL